jgi:hypothetical protein
MNLETETFGFTLLTPCFSGTALGKYDDHAEMRVPAVRGHIRFWHRVLFAAADANTVWGSTDGGEGQGSRVALRLVGDVPRDQEQPEPKLLPHKDNPNHRGPRPALKVGGTFTLQLQRLVGCTSDDWDHAQNALRLWLLVGSVGLRSSRAAGSVWPINPSAPQPPWVPRDASGLSQVLRDLGLASWSVALIGEKDGPAEAKLRETASDTIQGNPYRQVFGGINERFPSPTKFKVVHLSTGPCLLATAPRQEIVCEDRQKRPILREAERLLLHVKPDTRRWAELGPWHYIFP